MDVWKYEIIYRVDQDISLVHFAHSWVILVNTRNKFHISAHPCIILYLFYILLLCNIYYIPFILLQYISWGFCGKSNRRRWHLPWTGIAEWREEKVSRWILFHAACSVIHCDLFLPSAKRFCVTSTRFFQSTCAKE